ncbi:serine hydrolase [Paractinoplanes rishiriensis]|uniref:serine hydrolase n=1 Tax=Paractinoplanes rishiriensis TaxID=1050105 RepID=UPI003F68D2C4
MVGPNGAGKSTLLNLIVGTIRPTSGVIEVLGARPAANAAQLSKVGFVAQDTPVYAGLTVAEHLRLGAKLNADWDAGLAQRRIAQLGLDPAQKAGRLSGGQRAQLALTVAAARRPQLLIFDEPVAALDPLARRAFLQNLMDSVAELEATVILSSHLLGDLQRVCDHLVVLTASQVQLAGDVDDVLAAHYRLVGRPDLIEKLPTGVEVIHTECTARQSTLIVRDTSGVLPRLLPELLPTATLLELEDTWTPAELLAFTDGQPLLFEPGTSWAYANTNYILLALIVQKATGRPYATEIERRILRPLGLRNTELPGTNANLTRPHPHGYLPREHDGAPEPVDITVLNPTVAGASGELISTTTDLNRFYRALLTGPLLRPAQRALMRTARPTGRSYDYGLGLQTRQLANGTRLWGHEGDIFGYQTSCWTTEDGSRELTVAATPGGTGDLDELFDNLVATAFTHA